MQETTKPRPVGITDEIIRPRQIRAPETQVVEFFQPRPVRAPESPPCAQEGIPEKNLTAELWLETIRILARKPQTVETANALRVAVKKFHEQFSLDF
jgi:hypothetical protein